MEVATFNIAALQPIISSYSYTGGPQSFTAPPGVDSVTVDALGAQEGTAWPAAGAWAAKASALRQLRPDKCCRWTSGVPVVGQGLVVPGGTAEGLAVATVPAAAAALLTSAPGTRAATLSCAFSDSVVVGGGGGGGGNFDGGSGGGAAGGSGAGPDPGSGGTQTAGGAGRGAGCETNGSGGSAGQGGAGAPDDDATHVRAEPAEVAVTSAAGAEVTTR